MGEVKTPDVAVTLVDSIVADDAPAGAIKFYEALDYKPAGFHFQCPCGCRSVGAVRVAGDRAWEWNGRRTSQRFGRRCCSTTPTGSRTGMAC